MVQKDKFLSFCGMRPDQEVALDKFEIEQVKMEHPRTERTSQKDKILSFVACA